MSKYSISELDTTNELNEDDLILLSRKNSDGTYSSYNASIGTIANSDIIVGSGAGNGTTDTINLFLPTTAFDEQAFNFMENKTVVTVTFPNWYYVGLTGKPAGDETRQMYKVATTTVYKYITTTKAWHWKDSEGMPSGTGAGLPLPNVENPHPGWTIDDIGKPEFLEMCVEDDILDKTFATSAIRKTQKESDSRIYLIKLENFTESSERDTATVLANATGKWQETDIGSDIFNECCHLCTLSYPVVQLSTFTLPDEHANLDKYIDNNAKKYLIRDAISCDYLETLSATTVQLTGSLLNATLYTQAVTVDEDAAIYVYCSFTCSRTTAQGQSYYADLQLKDKNNWRTIYRLYCTTDNDYSRTSFNYSFYAKAGVTFRATIKPLGNAGKIYMNLSDFSYVRCKMTGQFTSDKILALQIPFKGTESTTYKTDENCIVSYNGAFSYYGSYKYPNVDRTPNVYFERSVGSKYAPLNAVQITKKNGLYSSYKYFIPANTNLRFRSAMLLGNTSSYPPYGSNVGVLTITPTNVVQDDIDYVMQNATKLTFILPPVNYITNGISHANKPLATIGVASILYNGQNPKADSDKDTGSSLWVNWNNTAFELADGADSLYYCTATTDSTSLVGTKTMEIENTLSKIGVSSKTSKAALYVASNLTEVNNIGTAIESLDDYCFYNCSNLRTFTTGGTSQSAINVKNIGEYAFSGCKALTGSLSFPAIDIIGKYAFNDCELLNSLEISHATTINDHAFYNCAELNSVNAINALTIGNYAFSGKNYNYTPRLANITFNATSIGEYAFKDCRTLTTASIPNATIIGKGAFLGCNSLTTLNISNAETIKQNAFYSCTALTSVVANKIALIENGAFNASVNCIFDFSNIVVPPTLKNANAFPSVSKKDWKVYVKDQATLEVYEASPIWKTFNTKNKKGEYTRQHIFVKPAA